MVVNDKVQVFFVGAGPGDPELITCKGKRLLEEAEVIIYAGSLVNPAVLQPAKASAKIYNSASMTLDEVLAVIKESVNRGEMVVRLHTGDPSIYGAIQEQMDQLAKENISFEVVPGVSSFLAAAAALKQEYTLPGVTQTVIITRLEGRTPMPEKEQLKLLASHQATICIFLSIHMIESVVAELLEGGYTLDTPVAIVQKASWPDQKIVRGTLRSIAKDVTENKIDRTAMIIVSNTLNSSYDLSCLYSPAFSHAFRDAK